jgi:gamma-aminobutyric acid type B receptor
VNLEKEEVGCTKDQMRIAAEGHLTTEALMWNQNNQRTISGKVITDITCVLICACCTFFRIT